MPARERECVAERIRRRACEHERRWNDKQQAVAIEIGLITHWGKNTKCVAHRWTMMRDSPEGRGVGPRVPAAIIAQVLLILVGEVAPILAVMSRAPAKGAERKRGSELIYGCSHAHGRERRLNMLDYLVHSHKLRTQTYTQRRARAHDKKT